MFTRPLEGHGPLRRVFASAFQAGGIVLFIGWRWSPSGAADLARALGGADDFFFME
jgi:hypothetical protein